MEYKPLYRWRKTWPGETGLDRKPLQDFIGLDGEVPVGRIRLEDAGPKRAQWQWSGQGPNVRERLLPHQGFCPTPRKASRMVEDYYHRLMRHNDMRGSQDVD